MTRTQGRRFAVDATGIVSGGGISLLIGLLPAIARVDPVNEYEVFIAASPKRMRLDLPPRFRVQPIAFPKPVSGFRVLWQQSVLPGILGKRRVDALLSPSEICPLFSPCPVLLCVNNLNPYWGPRASTTIGRIKESLLARLTAASARRAGRVFFVTDASRRLIVPKLGIDEAKTTVIPYGVNPLDWEVRSGEDVLETLGLRRPYLLCVSAVRIHKDITTLVRAFGSLVRNGDSNLSLAVVGPVTDRKYYSSVLDLIRQEGLVDRVLLMGEMERVELACLYRHAELLVLPTRAETFGVPLIEAMAAGLAVVTTDLPVTREVCGDAARYVQVGDSDALAEQISSIRRSDATREAMVAAGRKRAKSFLWDDAARQVIKQLENISRQPP